MHKKALLELKKFQSRKNNNIFGLRFRSFNTALFFLKHKIFENELNFYLSNIQFTTAKFITFLSSKVFVFCPFGSKKSKNKSCITCPFKDGATLSIEPILVLGYLDPFKLQDFIRTQVQIKFALPCKQFITPKYRFLEKDKALFLLSTKQNQDVYLLTSSDYSLDRINKLYIGFNFFGNLKVWSSENYFCIGTTEKDLKTNNINHALEELLWILNKPEYKNSIDNVLIFADYFKSNRISKKYWNSYGLPEKLLADLHKHGFLSYSDYRYYKTKKLNTVLNTLVPSTKIECCIDVPSEVVAGS